MTMSEQLYPSPRREARLTINKQINTHNLIGVNREQLMTPAEVIAMRDKLSEWLATEYKDNSDVLAESLIKSGWVTQEPERRE